MCNICGCGQGEIHSEGQEHENSGHKHVYAYYVQGHVHPPHHHTPAHAHMAGWNGPVHTHAPGVDSGRLVQIEQDLLAYNQGFADANRRFFEERGILALNLVSSPGSGKTSLLVKTIEAVKAELPVAVIEGDQQTSRDADCIRATGAPAVQINTGKGCHLDAHRVGHALEPLALPDGAVLFIENVGNLVCPAGFDLGEAHKVVILSVTEGEDKPLKYPHMFAAADLMILNKIDLLPYLDFAVEQCLEYARRSNPDIAILQLSTRTGAGMTDWLEWLRRERRAALPRLAGLLETRLTEVRARLGA